MKLIYRCSNCGAQRDFDLDTSDNSVAAEFSRLDAGGNSTPRRWIRHPCQAGVHGIANLVAIAEGTATE